MDLLYITRCSDGKFALCMDSSPTPPPTTTKIDEKIISPTTNNTPPKPKRRNPRKKIPKQKPADKDDDIVVLSEKPNINPQPSSSSITKHPTPKEKPLHKYVLMKHRRCYSINNPTCLHSLTLEYNICRERTIRHMCQTHDILKRRILKPKLNRLSSIYEVAKCLKTIVNDVVNMEENR